MKKGLREIRKSQNIEKWSKQVEECNNSGLSVSAWCKEKGIPESTYHTRAKRVLEEYSNIAPSFVPIDISPIYDNNVAITMVSNGAEINIHNGANEDTITAVLRAIRNAK